ncbi:maleylpyruvate isomerase N-terminal domain-containing protein [Lapillicoccus jejuensis]|uniref:Uncharacterized protein (TIGR03083 family) n=1 Tax=Lapillicoccus jejuensis TaxID=402171 RepID=A0A542DXB1_9MICO|nr:maleylpyruvate isomerase N-terminal domain-containing protein [Lapillicoccus jejuensis]TQJ07719.1 uncharacterized protein (TIGR03083 family) [Lapillicoccus jejuensis]
MPARLDLDAYGDALGDAATVLRENARLAGAGAPVPTCPGWTVGDLVLHTGLVHRWAAAILRGASPRDAGPIDVPADGAGAAALARDAGLTGDPYEWYDAQCADLLQAVVDTDPDADVWFFLRDAPPPRLGWTRRQAHEVTVHAVDAMASRLGRAPAVRELWFRSALAVDGVDELLTGFVPRPSARLRSATPYRLLVEAADTGDGWLLEVAQEPVVTTPLAPGESRPDHDERFTADAVPLYLHLWNREPDGSVLDCTDPAVLARWREQLRVV